MTVALTLTTSAAADPPPHMMLSSAYKPSLEACPSVKQAIGFYRRAYTTSRNAMGLAGAVPRSWYDCKSSRRRALEWRDRAWQAKHAYAKWRHERTIVNTDNWVRAMKAAQRPFPGTLSWLQFISGRECRACWTTPGGFICNYQGSGACGPMQFMSGTFYGYADDARDHLTRHGFIVDAQVWDWRNPLGQALTAAYMRYTGRDGCHWCL